MRKLLVLLSVVLLILVLGVTQSSADVYLDMVISFDQPAGSEVVAWQLPGFALGEPEDDGVHFISIDLPETLIVAFTDNTAIDGPGDDIKVFEVGGHVETVQIYASMDNISYIYLGNPSGIVSYDISSYDNLDYINYLKFVGDWVGTDVGTEGYDLDAVEALNSGTHIPIPSAVWLLGSGLIGIIGIRRKFRN